MNCWHCGTELIWGGDHDLDDYEDMEYDIVTNLSCPKCESYVEVYHKIEKYGFSQRIVKEIGDEYTQNAADIDEKQKRFN